MAKITLFINDTNSVSPTLVPAIIGGNNNASKSVQLQKLLEYVFQNPSTMAIMTSGTTPVKASATLTLASVVATNSCEVYGTTFTAVASGATGQQFNVGASDTLTAVNLKNAINATAGVNTAVLATSDGAVVTVTAQDYGAMGNALPISGGTNITASGSTLAGGVSLSYTLQSGVTFS